jgi:hypothetical protein
MDIGCQVCGQLNPPGTRACQYCGARMAETPPYDEPSVPRWRPTVPLMPQWQARAQAADQWGYPLYAQRGHGLKDPNTGLVVELIPGLFFFLGIGHLWAGEIGLGLALLFGYWFALSALAFLTVITFGLLLCVFPIYLLMWPGVPIASAILLQRRLRRAQQQLVRASMSPHPY